MTYRSIYTALLPSTLSMRSLYIAQSIPKTYANTVLYQQSCLNCIMMSTYPETMITIISKKIALLFLNSFHEINVKRYKKNIAKVSKDRLKDFLPFILAEAVPDVTSGRAICMGITSDDGKPVGAGESELQPEEISD